LVVGRIDPVKNQSWLVDQLPTILSYEPRAILVLAGPILNAAYDAALRERIRHLRLDGRIVLTGGFAPADPVLIGLLQSADAVIQPSLSETFGIALLEAWACARPVLAS